MSMAKVLGLANVECAGNRFTNIRDHDVFRFSRWNVVDCDIHKGAV